MNESSAKNDCGVVIIGRNEGERLRVCLSSVVNQTSQTIYVDSGSTDSSVSIAKDLGAEVVELDMDKPFTAARARNAGFTYLMKVAPKLSYVQFVDGDCEVVDNWISDAQTCLEENPNMAVVCGRRRERFPGKSIYNQLCNIEWDTPIGEAKACGGDALMRVNAFKQVDGYRDDLIAGEEPELCVRLRLSGWKIWRLDQEMTMHDAAMTKFTQWWNRSKRAGYAYTEGAHIHGKAPLFHRVKEVRRVRLWALWIPLIIVVLTVLFGWIALLLVLVYPLQMLRLMFQSRISPPGKWWHSLFLVLGKFPEMSGQILFFSNRIRSKSGRIIEYK